MPQGSCARPRGAAKAPPWGPLSSSFLLHDSSNGFIGLNNAPQVCDSPMCDSLMPVIVQQGPSVSQSRAAVIFPADGDTLDFSGGHAPFPCHCTGSGSDSGS